MKVSLNISHSLVQALDTSQRKELQIRWDGIVMDPLAFVPTEEVKRGVTPQAAKEENMRLGAFAADFVKDTMADVAIGDTAKDRLARCATIAAVGYGKSYDSGWFARSIEAGFKTVWIDVSEVACRWAREDLQRQYKSLPSSHTGDQLPRVIQCDIESVLADPKSFKFRVENVEIWYFGRIIGCMSPYSAEMVLAEIGRAALSEETDPERRRAVIIVNALKDCNPGAIPCNSHLWRRNDLLKTLSDGAGRPVEIAEEKSHPYFRKTVSAMRIVAMTG